MEDWEASKAIDQAREQVRHAIERLEEIRADLLETVIGLRLPAGAEGGKEDLSAPLAGLFELDAVIRCVVHDHLKPLIVNLRSLLREET